MFWGETMQYKKLFILIMILFILASVPFINAVGASSELWSQTYGGASYDTAQSVVETSDGGYAIAGGTTSFGAGEYDFWLIKTDAYGNKLWNWTYGGINHDYAYSLIETSDRGFALIGTTGGTGSFLGEEYDVLLVKTDEYGNMEWDRTYGGKSGDNARCLVETSDKGYAFAGYTDFSSGGCDFWLVKTDMYGNMEWDRTYGKIDEEITQMGGGTYNRGSSLVETSDGGFAMAGCTRSYGAGLDDFWLIKTDAYGNIEWNQTYGGVNSEIASSLVKTSDGGYTIAGYTDSFGAGARDFWLVKTDAYGNMEWNQTYGGEGYEDANSLVETSDGGYILAGAVDSVTPVSDWWVVRTDAYGIPEFPSWAILPLLLVATLVVMLYKQRLPKTSGK